MPPPIGPEITGRPRYIGSHELALYNQLCNFYTVSVELGSQPGAVNKAARQIRPEPFVVRRISWATTGDAMRFCPIILTGQNSPSVQGRTVRASFGDSFTNFMGQQPGMVSAVFGDSHGFMDMPKGIVFSGSQNLEVTLNRIVYPAPTDDEDFIPPETTRWDFVFAGVSLLPKYINQSGSE